MTTIAEKVKRDIYNQTVEAQKNKTLTKFEKEWYTERISKIQGLSSLVEEELNISCSDTKSKLDLMNSCVFLLILEQLEVLAERDYS